MARALPCLAGLALLLTYGVAEGLMNHRWTPSAELEQAAARLPDIPRVDYGRSPAVYKLYVIRSLGDRAGGPAQDPVVADFLKAFLPAAQTTLSRSTPE